MLSDPLEGIRTVLFANRGVSGEESRGVVRGPECVSRGGGGRNYWREGRGRGGPEEPGWYSEVFDHFSIIFEVFPSIFEVKSFLKHRARRLEALYRQSSRAPPQGPRSASR